MITGFKTLKAQLSDKVPFSDLNRPKGFIISPLPSGEQQTDNLLNIVAWPKNEVHLLCAAYHILQQHDKVKYKHDKMVPLKLSIPQMVH